MSDGLVVLEGDVSDTDGETSVTRIVYLLGAGATQGAVSFGGSARSLIMPGLIESLNERMREHVEKEAAPKGVQHLVNDVVSDETDFEHLLTFLEDTPSDTYRTLARELKQIFSAVLREALTEAATELGDEHSALYAVLLDMHDVPGAGEELSGFLTLNYDTFLEHAIEERLGRAVDYGVGIRRTTSAPNRDRAVRVLKLHGSFDWRHTWPIELARGEESGLWIPPGIRKAKGDYPFNEIWGAARELLDCDILRIVGCNLGSNDWDLISLLFTTMHGRDAAAPYRVEVIAHPRTANRIAKDFPYLNARSLLEIPSLGAQLVAEVLGTGPTEFLDLDENDQDLAVTNANDKISNPFERWLRVKGELMVQDLPTIDTPAGIFAGFVNAS